MGEISRHDVFKFDAIGNEILGGYLRKGLKRIRGQTATLFVLRFVVHGDHR